MIRDDGFTLLEATVPLSVFSLLAGVAATSAGARLERSRRVQARDDAEKIGHAFADFHVDNGFSRSRVAAERIDGIPLGAVWVLFAGPNGILKTPHFQPGDQVVLWGGDIEFGLR